MMRTKAQIFRDEFEKPGLLMRPCAYDSLSAKVIEQAGFRVMGTSGYGISAVAIGEPDIGLLSFGGMFDQCRRIINAVEIPVDVDADTGYGNEENTYWTVRKFAEIGASAVRIEDQTWPKRCGHMSDKQVIGREEMALKIKAAKKAAAEIDPGMMIGARTDSLAVEGLRSTLERINIYAENGADYIYVECPRTHEEIEILVRHSPRPISMNIIPGGKSPFFDPKILEDLGIKYLSLPMICLYPAVKAMREALIALKNGDLQTVKNLGVTWSEFNDIVGLKFWQKLRADLSSVT
ncbi:MAG TPA: isocitrate lyase/PEP mutase family protein [Candidatus Saccharicenans sp.]|jgi:methylisocitrate lyase|nr:isocitrate lyase/PEP mutase family protein [Candidatus Saccharicenans sp.]HRD01059.1 isocitrate lyase/PEP mutase family protein [Candidatus Saccharicenans sp.]